MKNHSQLLSFSSKNINHSQISFLIIKEIFSENNYCKYEVNLKKFLDKLGEEKQKRLEKFAYFYYYICQPYASHNDVREELRLIGITSLIEGMMQEVEHKDFFQWFESTYKDNKIEDYSKTKEEYLKQFGAISKIKAYFENYILEEDKKSLLECIKPFKNNSGFVQVDSIIKIATFLYSMRSEFVHEARMCCLCPENCHLACICVNGKPYEVNIRIEEFMEIFERSFILFWKKQAKQKLQEVKE